MECSRCKETICFSMKLTPVTTACLIHLFNHKDKTPRISRGVYTFTQNWSIIADPYNNVIVWLALLPREPAILSVKTIVGVYNIPQPPIKKTRLLRVIRVDEDYFYDGSITYILILLDQKELGDE